MKASVRTLRALDQLAEQQANQPNPDDRTLPHPAFPNGRLSSCSVATAKLVDRRWSWTEKHDYSFPDVSLTDKVHFPFGSRVLIQVRTPQRMSEGGLHMSDDTLDIILWNTQVGLIRALGPLAFCNRETALPWAEGLWAKPGDFIRIPKYAGDRVEVPLEGSERNFALFTTFNDLDLLGRVEADPLKIKAYV